MKLKQGAKAPAFSGKDENGNIISLRDFKGKKLALFFYPNDDTPGCTAEACNLRDNYTLLQKTGYEILGVSANDEKSHRKFINKYRLPFHLIADTGKEICKAYGVWQLKKFMGRTFMGVVRTTFIIDEKGMIRHLIREVNTERHAEQILEGPAMPPLIQRYIMNGPVQEVFKALTDTRIMEQWSGAKAIMEKKKRGKFSLWNGEIYGRNLEIIRDKKIVQEWYAGNWTRPSTVTISLTKKAGKTEVELLHEGIPEKAYKGIKEGWDLYYLGEIREMLKGK